MFWDYDRSNYAPQPLIALFQNYRVYFHGRHHHFPPVKAIRQIDRQASCRRS